MPVKNNYSHYKLNSQGKRTSVKANFLGVDFSTPSFNVASSRAINIKNFIFKENGSITKRHGYEQIAKVEEIEYVVKDFDSGNSVEYAKNGVNFNGIWKFKAEDGQWHIVAHIGNLLFEIKDIDDQSQISIEPLTTAGDENIEISVNGTVKVLPRLYKYEDYKSFAFVGAKRLWFLGGNKYMCIRFNGGNYPKVYPVANRYSNGDETEDAFVPTTSYNITYKGAAVQHRSLLDAPNKLNYFRKNKLLSGVGKDESGEYQTKYYEYELDAPLMIKSQADLNKIYVVIKSSDRKDKYGN